jgi:hypothetical protein
MGESRMGYLLAIAIVVVGLSASGSIACDCLYYPRLNNETDPQYTKRIEALQISQSEIVVQGRFVKTIPRGLFSRLERRFAGHNPDYTGDLAGGVFKIDRITKGRVTASEIKVFTEVHGEACGAPFLITESLKMKRRLSFAIQKIGSGPRAKYRTSSCHYYRWLDATK